MHKELIQYGGYAFAYSVEHPRSHKHTNRIPEHIIIAENALGKHLPDDACVHHVNGNGLDNRNENLVICEDNAYHKLLHVRTKALEACGNPNWRKCLYCKKYDSTENLRTNSHNHHFHRACKNSYERSKGYRQRKKEASL